MKISNELIITSHLEAGKKELISTFSLMMGIDKNACERTYTKLIELWYATQKICFTEI